MRALSKFRWNQILVSLFLGLAIGIFYGHWSARHPSKCFFGKKPGSMKEMMLNKLDKELQLSPDQREKVKVIFESKKKNMMALHQEMRPKFEAVKTEIRAEIRKVLRPDQIGEFEKFNAKMEKRFKRRGDFSPASAS